jgi:indole-3-pyruvate monooxygenase
VAHPSLSGAPETSDALVVGAGFCGLAAGAALRARGVRRFAIVEQGARVGHFWTQTYDRLHLHSAFHDLPRDGGLRRDYPIFLSRDELLDYFARCAELHGLAPHLRLGTRVERIHRLPLAEAGMEWELETTRGPLRARYLAVATAVNRVPKEPELPGRAGFRGRVLHSAAYRNARPFAGRSVLVVGSGTSAAEIAPDLVEGGAKAVALWVRAPRHFIPIRRMELLFRVFRLLGALSEKQAAATHRVTWGTPEFERIIAARDRLTALLSVDLSRYGIRKPERGPMAELCHAGRIPTFDQGAIGKIRSGAIRVIDGNRRPLEGSVENGVRLGEGSEPCDDVVLATGFEPRLDEFLDVPELLGPVLFWKRYPLTDGRSRSRVHPSVFFPGFDRTPLGGQSLGRWGFEVGECIADALG